MGKYAELILDAIEHSNAHLTADDIYNQLRDESCSIALATVYNNLNALTEQGMIRRIVMEDGPDRYDKIARHDHLICSQCGKLSDFSFEDITESLERMAGVHIESYDLRAYYVCEDCREDSTE